MIGYFTNRALQEHESVVAARGAARVYQARLLHVARDLSVMLEGGRALDPRPTVPPDLGVDDKRVMASELSDDQWADVVRSESALRQLQTVNTLVAAPDTGTRINATTCTVLHAYLRQLVRGATALAALAHFDVPRDARLAGRGLRC
jgi:hypothetical protein